MSCLSGPIGKIHEKDVRGIEHVFVWVGGCVGDGNKRVYVPGKINLINLRVYFLIHFSINLIKKCNENQLWTIRISI